MNQTRTFLLFALLAVAYLLFQQWEQDYGPHPPTPAVASNNGANGSNNVPGATPTIASGNAGETGASQLVTVTTDVLRLTVDTRGGSIVRSELLQYPVTPQTKKEPHPAPIRLLDDSASDYFAAQSGLVSADGAAPDHRAIFQAAQTSYELASGQDVLNVDLSWTDPSGVKVIKRYTVHRGSYVVDLDQQIDNGSSKSWDGNAYHQLQRVDRPAPVYSNFLQRISDQSRYGFFGAAWYSPDQKFNKLAFDKFEKEPLDKSQITGGWVAMMQQYFLGAWIPPAKEASTFSSAVVNEADGKPRYVIRSVSPQISVAPGQHADNTAQLYLGPKLPSELGAIAPGLDLTIDYGMLKIFAEPLHWILAQLDKLTGNWGVSIILLVLLINLATFKLTNAQFESANKMRKLKPRVDALKERYGDDRQKMQQAMMELYKKEKVNPAAGCFPLLITIPIFYGLYYVLRDSVELRQAPFFGWIHDLSAADPYFVLPILYTVVMLVQQWVMPVQPGMDPAQQKMMKFMPLMFAVIFLFFPSGLVLYYVVNGLCRLLQQWWMMRRADAVPAKAAA
ncbi:membrane protein insertase YidC [Dyella nitratireducens]|uniref:Membrane protein insertase YidC n=1 Tax=Dyella nitratireducens TaxID=1849580 RepID=A0ABQ1FUN1_9GAMM|nr:membrane protein insertase YidC [Dyella nitratireducens]GGA30864.1 membrane protein insertase YidC [Dyella nitratireducens]GLQ42949.1 membrane protein insertase YidC [Dyella nitratireducens]